MDSDKQIATDETEETSFTSADSIITRPSISTQEKLTDSSLVSDQIVIKQEAPDEDNLGLCKEDNKNESINLLMCVKRAVGFESQSGLLNREDIKQEDVDSDGFQNQPTILSEKQSLLCPSQDTSMNSCLDTGPYTAVGGFPSTSFVDDKINSLGLGSFLCLDAGCGKAYGSEQELIEHVHSNHINQDQLNIPPTDGPGFACSYEGCNKSFKYKYSMERHVHTHGTVPLDTLYYCPNTNCDKCSQAQGGGFIDKQAHDSGTRLVCKIEGCGKAFRYLSEYKNHIVCHSTERPFVCAICDSTFKSSKRMREHVRLIHTTSRVKEHRCPEDGCPRIFWSRSYLQEHMASHSEQRPFSCSEPSCSRSYKRKKALLEHQRKAHSAEVPYQVHLNSSVNPFICTVDECGQSFETKSKLTRHFASFHDQKNTFQCDGCSKGFRYKSDLEKHAKMHK